MEAASCFLPPSRSPRELCSWFTNSGNASFPSAWRAHSSVQSTPPHNCHSALLRLGVDVVDHACDLLALGCGLQCELHSHAMPAMHDADSSFE